MKTKEDIAQSTAGSWRWVLGDELTVGGHVQLLSWAHDGPYQKIPENGFKIIRMSSRKWQGNEEFVHDWKNLKWWPRVKSANSGDRIIIPVINVLNGWFSIFIFLTSGLV